MAELGDGWAPAVIENRRELDFIRRAQRWFDNIATYFIGGYTNFNQGNIIRSYSLHIIGAAKTFTLFKSKIKVPLNNIIS